MHFLSPRYVFLSMRKGQLGAWGRWRENLADRLSQADLVLRDVAPKKGALIDLGDFNARESSLVVQRFLAPGMRDAYGEAGRSLGFTYGHPEHKHPDVLRVDHILVLPEVRVNQAVVESSRRSDHHPIRAVLSLEHSSRSFCEFGHLDF
jgi:endonuclease/exonuclease/phosphatase family metal-dependent hydrolase